MSEESRKRFLATCAYDGTDYHGWQVQPGGLTVQEVLETRLATVLGTATRIHASGRTDSGVHARGQTFHFDAAWRHGPKKLALALDSGLPENIQVRAMREVDEDFHARFNATSKRYLYQLSAGRADPLLTRYCWSLRRPLDLEAMRAVAKALEGRHNFRAFSALRGDGSDEPEPVRNLTRLEVVQRGSLLKVWAEADGFLYKMVRSLVGALVEAGLGKLKPEDIRPLLEAGERKHAIQTAPPQGLSLEKVFYD